MMPLFVRVVAHPARPAGEPKYLPAEVSTPVPRHPVKEPRHLEHPLVIRTPLCAGIAPMEPTNDSSLAIGQSLDSQRKPRIGNDHGVGGAP